MLTQIQKTEVTSGIRRVQTLFDSAILQNNSSVIAQSALIDVLINMKDLLIKSEKHLSKRVDFIDDVVLDTKPKIRDVTDLINNFRDAAAHNDTDRRNIPNGRSYFNVMGRKGVFLEMDGLTIENKYDDDIAYNMGKHVLYLNRHLIRAFEELKANFQHYI